MKAITCFALYHPKLMMLGIVLVTVVLGAGLPRLSTVVGYRAYVGDTNLTVQQLDTFIERFGGGLPIVAVFGCHQSDPCKSVFDPEALMMAYTVANAMRPIDGVLAVESPATSPLIVPTEGGFTVRRLIESGWPVPDLDKLSARAASSPLWQSSLVSSDGRVGAIVIEMASSQSEQYLRVVTALQRTLAPFDEQGFTYHLLGEPVKHVITARDLKSDVQRLTPIAMFLIALIVFILFRSWQAVAASLALLAITLIWTLGAMGWIGWPQTEFTNALIPMLLVVCICDGIHILARYAHERAQQEPAGSVNRNHLLVSIAGDVGIACVITSATTAAGVLSFAPSGIASLVHFGVVAAIGIAAALLLSFTFLPITIAWLPPERIRANKTSEGWETALKLIVRTSERRAVLIGMCALVTFIVCGLGMFWLQVDLDDVELYGEQNQYVMATRFAEVHLRKPNTLEVELAIPENELLGDPQTLAVISAFSEFLSSINGLGRTQSIVDSLEWVNRSLHGDDHSFQRTGNTLTANQDLLLLLSLQDSRILRRWVSLDHRRVRISVEGSDEPMSRRNEIRNEVTAYLNPMIGAGWQAILTGPMEVNRDLMEEIKRTQRRSLLTATLVVFVLATLFLGSIRLGLAAILSTLLPVVAVLGTMGLSDINLDVGTAMVAAIILGIGVDDTLHILSQYKRRRRTGKERSEAIVGAVQHVGRAVVTTSAALALGFFSMTFSHWQSIASFGFLSGVAIIAALAAALFVLPVLLMHTSQHQKDSLPDRAAASTLPTEWQEIP